MATIWTVLLDEVVIIMLGQELANNTTVGQRAVPVDYAQDGLSYWHSDCKCSTVFVLFQLVHKV